MGLMKWIESWLHSNGCEEVIFGEYYRQNFWNDPDSVSGPGSNLAQTGKISKELPGLIAKFGVESILDVACGDFFWMKEVDLGGAKYVGGDVVPALISDNNARYASSSRMFVRMNILRDEVPQADLVICRDCLVHFPYRAIKRAIKSITRSNSRYLLTTTFIDRRANKNIKMGEWRPVNLQLSPFNFPKPIKIINEGCTEGDGLQYADKSLALWKIEDLK